MAAMSFRLKTILGVAVIQAIVLAILTMGTLDFLRNANERQLRDYARVTASNVAAMAQDGVLAMDLGRLLALARRFEGNPGIAYVRIFDNRQRILAAAGSHKALARPFLGERILRDIDDSIFDVAETIAVEGIQHGRVEIGIDIAPLESTLNQARRKSLSIALAGLVVVALLSAALGTYLTRQLTRLEQGSRRLRDGELGLQITVEGHDELARMAVAFNDMSRQLLEDQRSTNIQQQLLLTQEEHHRRSLEDEVAARTEELRNAEAQARLILESSAAGLYGLDRDGRVIFVNPAACRMLAYTTEQAIGHKVDTLWKHPDTAGTEPVADGEEDEAPGREQVFWRTDGQPIPVLVSSHAMVRDGTAIGSVVSFLDISATKATAQRLRASEREFRALTDHIPDTVVRHDLQLRITYANPEFLRTCGLESNDALGKTPDELGPFDDHQASLYRQALARVTSDSDTSEVELSLATPDGSRVYHLRMVAERAEGGEITGILAIGRDITARLKADRAREKALREAERLARLRSEFLANMSHEIRTPLNAVLGIAQLGLRESSGRKVAAQFARIVDAGQLLLALVNDILDFSKIEAGRLALEQGTVVLAQVIDQAVDTTSPRAYAKGLRFRVDEMADLPASFSGDSLRLTQVLVNLLANAVKFTEHGIVELRVRRHGDSLVFTVADSGIGMTQEQIDKLFTPFQQADGSTTRRFGGTGLGLAISKRLVDLMKGRFEIRSEPGIGTAFELHVPIADSPSAPARLTAGTVLLAGVDDTQDLIAHLWRRGITARAVSPDTIGAGEADLIVVGYSELSNHKRAALIEGALDRGQKIAIAGIPAMDRAIPAHLADRLPLLDWPLRARHVVSAITQELCAPRTSAASSQRLAGLSVLAAEDNDINRLVLEEMLAMEGARLVCLDNGRLALEHLRRSETPFDVVVTDVQMPEMDGYELARQVRALHPELPVIGLTAHAMAEEQTRCLAAGMSAHISKPVDIDTLVATILAHTCKTASLPLEAEVTGLPSSPPTAPRSQVPFDRVALETRFRGNSEFVDRLLATTAASQAGTPKRLRQLAESGSPAELAHIAHGLKGLCGNLTAHSARQAAVMLDHAARAGDPASAELARRLADEIDHLLAAISPSCRNEAGTQASPSAGNG